jgi:phospholipid/cholesterol/gamma-HCH transport system permease protein
MRVTEQIDALDVMGINSLNYLVLPKVISTVFFYHFLIILARVLGIFGVWGTGVLSGLFTGADYIEGVQTTFNPFLITYAMIKTLVFAFLIATVPSYHGYYVKGGSIAVGKASTQSVVWTIILIVLANYLLTQMLLT